MRLRFPNARLFIYNLIAEGTVSGSEAIALSAYEFGLLDELTARGLQKTLESCRNCTCMETARKVLHAYFDRRCEVMAGAAVDTEEIWKAIEADASSHASNGPKPTVTDECCHDCAKFAPALFDFLLQHIRRYP